MLLYRYVVKEHIFPFLASLSIVIFLFIMQQAILMLDRIVSKNIDPLIVLEVFLIQLGWILALGIPMAVLASTLMTFGRMAGDNEITAIKASGRSMAALIVPVMAASAVVTVALFCFHDLVLPEANHRAANLLGDISRKRPAAFIEPGVLIRDFQNYALYTEEVNSFTGDLRGIRIFSDAPGEDPMVTVAESGNIRMTSDGEYLELSLFNGESHSMSHKNDKDYFIARFKTQVIYIKNVNSQFERTNSNNRGDREKNLAAMMADVRAFKASNREMAAERAWVTDSISAVKSRLDSLPKAEPAASKADIKSAPARSKDSLAPASTPAKRPTAPKADVKPAPFKRKDSLAAASTPAKRSTAPKADVKPAPFKRKDSLAAASTPAKRPAASKADVKPAPFKRKDAQALSSKQHPAASASGTNVKSAPAKGKDSLASSAAPVRLPAARPGPNSLSRREEGRLRQYEANIERIDRASKANDMLIAQYMVEVHKKFAIPAACLIFVLIGAPLGIMARRGGLAVGASYSVFFFIIYWVFLITGENRADKLLVPPALAMWAGNAFLTVCGVVLIVLMLRETSINFGFVRNFFGKGASAFRSVANSWVFRLPGMIFGIPRLLLNKINGRLPTYLMGTFLGYTLGLLAALIVIFITIDYVGNLRKFESATHIQTLQYYCHYTPWIALNLLPIVLFLASMFSMGKIAKTSELTAMKAAGVNIGQLTMPLLVLGLLLSAGVFYVGEMVIPLANEKRAVLQSNFGKPAAEQSAAAAAGTVREYRRNFYYFASPNIIYVYNEFCTDPQFFRGVRRYTFTPNGLAERIDAAEAEFDSTGWTFIDGQARVFTGGVMAAEKFKSRPDETLRQVPMDLVKRIKFKWEMSYWELSNHIEAAKRRGEKVHKLTAELDFKVAQPFMNFIVILFGLALAARTGRRGGAALFGVGLLLSFLFWILSRFMLVFAQNGYVPVLLGAWLGNMIFFVVGLILYRKASY
ncbi:MAG: LptF/LptG family permease [Chitinispirillia bacterium]|nr:LptF/LptG family permease [Chitinispirillia bacterium]MCL2242533.1 LptF/LptG family permease [Chitinispirillia bacterium]